jgi:hypothetical protein
VPKPWDERKDPLTIEHKQINQGNQYYDKVIDLEGINTEKMNQLKDQAFSERKIMALKKLKDQVIVITGHQVE